MKIAQFFLAIACIASTVVQAASPAPEILVTALRGKQWQVRYDFAQPVDKVEFKFSPDDSRVRTWLPDQGFEIVTTDRGEVARRKDGAHFSTVRFRMSPTYSVLPKNYAPFSPFGDGGMLFHTGRFFACQDSCPDDASWSMSLWAATEDQIILNGKAMKAQAHWVDGGDGRSVYVGNNVPQQTDDFIAVIDTALPERIRAQLLEQLPEFMHLFSGKLGALPTRPMLFVSYDVSHPKGWGRQGGVLPAQVFIHFYGSKWPAEMEKPNFPDELAWHFAHEAAHLYQRHTSTTSGDDWITEGSAEAFAAMALSADASAYVQSAEGEARGKCRELLKGRSVREAIAAGTFDVAYSCGMLINLAIDSRIRLATKNDGLYAVWRNHLGRASSNESVVSRAAYLEAISDVGNADIAEWVEKAVTDQGADLILGGAN
ncbi:hypothetical protein HNQ60_004824 [Povalibacter uvarum]|uniref:Peptidase M61 catalytic domain-containing protein n=1 Tax=Povalibacter uvarum TaxID=732238 RepID=A0A841HT27_9GAMM|nr:hypothetical protein [Povalibacter uvarum]MBB6095933.1 hypothetical protein [Povalibacter uvarum]